MGLLVYQFAPYRTTHEREQFRILCTSLRDFYSKSDEWCIFLSNYNIFDSELDGLIIKQDAIICVEFKKYGGEITAVDNGQWTTSDGTVIKGGSGKTVYQQVNINHVCVRKGMKAATSLSNKQLSDIAALVVFHRPITTLYNNLSEATQCWLHITDNNHFIEKVQDITTDKLYLEPAQMQKLIGELALDESYLLEEYSNRELLEMDFTEEDIPLEESDAPVQPINEIKRFNKKDEPEEDAAPSIKTSGSQTAPPINVPAPQNSPSRVLDITLPAWLDSYIFDSLNAKFNRTNQDMLVLEWNRAMILEYLGTYFPRSFAEAYSVFSAYFQAYPWLYANRKELSIFDFGCGTGGEIIGLLLAASEQCKSLERVRIKAFDGNVHALRLLESIIDELKKHVNFKIDIRVSPIVIDDFYDLSVLDSILTQSFDFVISFKAICEFVTKQQFESHNPYELIISTFKNKLTMNGVMCLADVTTYSGVSQDWLPKMMDSGISLNSMAIMMANEGYNETFTISHSHQKMDKSKIAWRIIKNKIS